MEQVFFIADFHLGDLIAYQGETGENLLSRQPFYIDQEGVLRSYYWDDEPIKAINIERK